MNKGARPSEKQGQPAHIADTAVRGDNRYGGEKVIFSACPETSQPVVGILSHEGVFRKSVRQLVVCFTGGEKEISVRDGKSPDPGQAHKPVSKSKNRSISNIHPVWNVEDGRNEGPTRLNFCRKSIQHARGEDHVGIYEKQKRIVRCIRADIPLVADVSLGSNDAHILNERFVSGGNGNSVIFGLAVNYNNFKISIELLLCYRLKRVSDIFTLIIGRYNERELLNHIFYCIRD